MPTFKIAHIREQGIDMIIVPLDANFGHKSPNDQNEIVADLQLHASNANLRGHVVPIWGNDRSISFIAPHRWHNFFKSISWHFVWANVNKELSW